MSDQTSTGNVVINVEERRVIISPVGETGTGVASGGTTNQALVKLSNNNFDTGWRNVVIELSGDGVDNSNPMMPTLTFPTPDEIGAYSNTNPDNFVDAAGAANAAPVQSVNGDTGNVSVYDGGVAGDILVKNSNTNYDTSWTDSITVDKITYDIAAAETVDTIGQTAWNADARTLSINKGNDVIQNITQDVNYPPSFNADSVPLTKGMLVMADPSQPAQGQSLRIVRYVSNGTYPVDLFVGMVIETIAVGELGFVEWFGQVTGLNIPTLQPAGQTWAEGDILWPNPAIAGGLTKIEPSAPAHKVTVAAILRISGNNANVLLRPNLRSKITDLHDVQITNVSNAQILSWNGTAWVNSNNEADGVLSVTGDGVDNTDPQNPVLSFPTIDDIGAYSNTNPDNFVNATGAASAAPIQTVTGDGVDNTNVGNVVISYPTIDDIGAYSNTNPSSYINVAQATSAAPIQSVTGTLVTGTSANPVINIPTVDQVGAYSNTNPANYINVAQSIAAAPVQSVNGQTNVVVLTKSNVGLGNVDNTSDLDKPISNATQSALNLKYDASNPANYINVAQSIAAAPVQSVNGKTNVVVLNANDVGAYSNTNPANYINVAQSIAAAPVQSVNGQTNVVVLTKSNVGLGNVDNTSDLDKPISNATQSALNLKYDASNPAGYINVAQAAAAAPVQSVTGTLVTGTSADPVVNIPTVDQVGAYSNTNPANYINVAQSIAAAPVQSVNGKTNVVVLNANDVGAYSNTNPSNFTNNTGTVTNVTAGSGLAGGSITTTGTISLSSNTSNSLNLANSSLQPSDVGNLILETQVFS